MIAIVLIALMSCICLPSLAAIAEPPEVKDLGVWIGPVSMLRPSPLVMELDELDWIQMDQTCFGHRSVVDPDVHRMTRDPV
jgi:hypothetical protein